MKKAIYSIFTSFLFIILAIIFFFVILFYQNIVVETQGTFHNSYSDLQLIVDTREKLFNCYGNPVNLDYVGVISCNNVLAKSFQIEKFDENGCTYQFKKIEISQDKIMKSFSFYVPIKEKTFSTVNCLGKLTINI